MPLDPTKLQIVHYPASVLRQKAKPVPAVTEEVKAVAIRMLELMHEAPGVGLAAPQVGLNWRMFVTNHTGEPEDDLVFINPVLSEPSRVTEDYEEGCLSLPDIRALIRRPMAISITAIGLDGQPFSLKSHDLPARIWQHETDHLDGVLILDRMSPGDRTALRRKIKELEEDAKR